MFTQARIKLTAWYVLVIFLISSSVSVLFYTRTTQVISAEYERINLRIQREMVGFGPPPGMMGGRRITLEDLDQAKQQIIWQLIVINSLVVTGFSIIGYWLTSVTLRPIERAHQAQKEFVSNAAHELRTPLTALKTSLEVALLEKKTDKATKQLLRDNLESVDSLVVLSDNLLSLAQIEEKHLELKPVSLQSVVKNALKTTQSLADKKHIQMAVTLPKTTSNILAHKALLTEAVVSLLENAIKFSPTKGTVAISVQTSRKTVLLQIADQGPGISQDDLPHIFERFYRVDTARSQSSQNGYGIGLAIVKQIVELHHGQIRASSTVGNGSTFSLTLPLHNQ